MGLHMHQLSKQRTCYVDANQSSKNPSAAGRPAIAQAWKDAFTDNQVDVLLYTGYSVPIPPIDAAQPNVQFLNGSISDLYAESFFNLDSTATATGKLLTTT